MNHIDFLPDRIRAHRKRRSHLRWQAVLLMACASVMAGIAYANHARIASAEQTLQSRQAQHQALQGQLKMVPILLTQQTDGQIKVRISKELGSRMDLNAVLAELCRLLPRSASLTALECSTVEMTVYQAPAPLSGGATPARPPADRRYKPPTEMRVKLTITGLAPTDVDVANFIGQLSACPLFEDVNMGYAKTVEIDGKKRKARTFQVGCLLVR